MATAEEEDQAFGDAIQMIAFLDVSEQDGMDKAAGTLGTLARQATMYKAGCTYWRARCEALQAENDRLWARVNEE